jgi:hypothetical protein
VCDQTRQRHYPDKVNRFHDDFLAACILAANPKARQLQ